MSNPILPDEIFEKCVYIAKNFEISIGNLQKKYGWERIDARLVIMTKGVRIMNAVSLGARHWVIDLKNPEWWKKEFPDKKTSEENQKLMAEEFETFLFVGMLDSMYSALESTIRIVSNAFDPKTFSNTSDDFSRIYPEFLTKLGLENYINLIRIYGINRNSVLHNDGIYNPRGKGVEPIEYKGKKHVFKVGELAPINWKDLLNLTFDLGELNYKIVTNEKISRLPKIVEPGSKYWDND